VVFAHTGASAERAGGTNVRMAGHGPYDRLPRDAGLDRDGARVALGIPAEAEVVLFFGQVRPYKGLDDLVEAFAEVAARRRDALLFVQARPHGPFDRYTARIEELGLAGRVTVRLGFFPLEEVIAAVRAADVVALPYREADQSGAAVLALGQGTPVVAGRVGGIPEIVPDGEAGYLVEPGDRAGLAGRIVEILEDDALRARLAKGARAASDRLPRWEDLAREALAAYPGVTEGTDR
jgi:glycosyltransferase involved in cell wall biosynthesis